MQNNPAKPQLKNIFLTGAPAAGKTTVIKQLIRRLPLPAAGFYTEEEREGTRRVGFIMRTLDGQAGYLAHQAIRSEYSIRRYGISLAQIEQLAVPAIRPRPGTLIILDEIGKMECFSALFRQAAMEALAAVNPVIGTITLGGGEFIEQIKLRPDLELIEVTPENRDGLPDELLYKLKQLLSIPGYDAFNNQHQSSQA